ncbi:hypothetical protein MMC19_003123 [Ptychographa xylographoides]|nr:hypothetical protein [Ptychographa xylographoides]
MRLLATLVGLVASISVATSLSLPQHNDALEPRGNTAADSALLADLQLIDRRNQETYAYLETRRELERRRGGGGGGKGGGSGGKGGGDSGGSGGSSGGRGSSSSSSIAPSYGGGRYYGGGSSRAFSAGSRSPLGIAPFFIGGAALGFFPGLWLYGAYAYPYTHPYYYHNSSAAQGQQNQSLPVECLCQEYTACGCDDNGNSTYVQSLVGNGEDYDTSLVRVAEVNGTKTLVINGTLPNGTDDSSTSGGAPVGYRQMMLEGSGFWVVGAVVGLIIWGL